MAKYWLRVTVNLCDQGCETKWIEISEVPSTIIYAIDRGIGVAFRRLYTCGLYT